MEKAKNVFMFVLGGLFTLGFFAVLGMFIFRSVPEGNATAMNILLGVLASGITTILGYFYGSSKSSADKTVLLSKADAIKEQ